MVEQTLSAANRTYLAVRSFLDWSRSQEPRRLRWSSPICEIQPPIRHVKHGKFNNDEINVPFAGIACYNKRFEFISFLHVSFLESLSSLLFPHVLCLVFCFLFPGSSRSAIGHHPRNGQRHTKTESALFLREMDPMFYRVRIRTYNYRNDA